MRRIIAGLDIGTDTIKLIVGEIQKNKLNVLTCIKTPSRGIKKGYIVNPESAKLALSDTFARAEEELGIPIKKVIVTVPSYGANCFMSQGSIVIKSEDKVINHNDLIKAMQVSVYEKIDDNMELVSILPTKFIINDEQVVKNPVNMIGNKLTVNDVIVTIPKKNSDNIIKCVESLDVKVVDIVISPLADYYEFKNDDYSSMVGAIINIGDSNTTVSIFNKGVLTASEVIDIGAINIESDIAYAYKSSRKDAKYIKEKLTVGDIHLAQASENITIIDANGDERKVSEYEASSIAISKTTEILNLAKKQINLLTKKEIRYIIITGGLCEMPHFDTLVSSVFGDLASIGNVNDIGARSSIFSVALGMIKYYNSRLKLRNADFSIFTIEEQEELGTSKRKSRINGDSILGKIYGYFFDN